MSIQKQIPKILDSYRLGWQDKRAGKPSRAKQIPSAQRKAYKNGYKQG